MVGYTKEQLEKAFNIVSETFQEPKANIEDGFKNRFRYFTHVEIALRAMGVTEVKPEKKCIYVNVYRASNGNIWVGDENNSRESADRNCAMGERIACKKIVEGEFDD